MMGYLLSGERRLPDTLGFRHGVAGVHHTEGANRFDTRFIEVNGDGQVLLLVDRHWLTNSMFAAHSASKAFFRASHAVSRTPTSQNEPLA